MLSSCTDDKEMYKTVSCPLLLGRCFINPDLSHGSQGPWKVIERAWCPWKVLENWKIVGYPWHLLTSPWILHRIPWIFLKAPWIKITFVKNKMFCAKEWLKAQQYTNCFGDHQDFGVPGIVHFLLFEVPWEPCLNEGRYYNKRSPFHLRMLKVFTSCYWEKKFLKNV